MPGVYRVKLVRAV